MRIGEADKKIQAEVIKEILIEKGAKHVETGKTTKLPAFLRNMPQSAIVATMFVLLAAFIAWLWFKPMTYQTGQYANTPSLGSTPNREYYVPPNRFP